MFIIFIGRFQQPTLSDMTQYELNFSLLVEQMLSKIVDPAYRQIIVEVRQQYTQDYSTWTHYENYRNWV